MGRLTNKVALVTGGASGLGKAVVTRFVVEGAKVCVADISQEKLNEMETLLGDSIVTIQGDVSLVEDNKRMIEKTISQFGKLDIFIGNAGIFDGNIGIAEMPLERLGASFDELFSINVKGMLFGAKLALPELAKTGGCMIFTASHASFYSAGGGPLYTASKHAIAGLIKELAFELAPAIRVNGVAPGVIATVMGSPNALGVEAPSIISGVEESLPLPFIPQPEEYADIYVLLASESSRVMTGTIIQADSGISIRGLARTSGGFKMEDSLADT
ncbi:SDR family NAD(P)-dependent oxidoreductase [Niallia sp. Krafla_26]|uniref:SDR family NAD(P)-dependent oxidoreductase n=1 Tax=Niallia sp. Krafla_26 TaxID=3064703 RepID=UPI003D17424A